MNDELYAISYVFSGGEIQLHSHVYRSLEDAETVVRAKLIDSPTLRFEIYRLDSVCVSEAK